MVVLIKGVATLLTEVRPELEKEWHEKNIIPFSQATTGHKKHWWKCERGHEWEQGGTHRGVNKSNCPYCSKTNRKPTKETSLATLSPHLINEWHEKNKKTPNDYTNFSAAKVWWKCQEKGHEWEARIHWRTYGGNNCPECKASKGEKIIADWLKENDIKYIHQYPMGKNGRLFDFYIPEGKIFVEIHGLQHFKETELFSRDLEYRQRVDAEKQAYAEAHGQYIMVDYREHDPNLALERFIDALAELP